MEIWGAIFALLMVGAYLVVFLALAGLCVWFILAVVRSDQPKSQLDGAVSEPSPDKLKTDDVHYAYVAHKEECGVNKRKASREFLEWYNDIGKDEEFDYEAPSTQSPEHRSDEPYDYEREPEYR